MKPKFTVSTHLRLFIVIALLLSATILAPGLARAAQTGSIALHVEAGYDGYFRGEEWLPLLISVSNNGPDVSGELRVTGSGTTGLTAGEYHTSIDLPTNSSKQVFLYVTLETLAQNVKVELANDSGILADDTRPIRPVMPSDLLYAVITESPRGTIDLTSVKTGAGESHQVNWRVDNIPRTASALRSLDIIILTDVDTGNLSNEQRQAIEEWVTGGGHLIVTGGPNWQKTQAGVTNLLPLKPASTTTLTSLPSVAAFAGHAGDPLDAPAGSPIVIAQGQLASDANVLIEESGIPLLARRSLGAGFVDYMSADPGIDPYQGWRNRADFWYTVFTTTGQQPNWADGVSNPNEATLAANLIKGLRLPDVFQLGMFLGVYIIVVGPLNYLILKRLGRRELAWFTIPLIIMACSVVSYITGFSLRGTQATINRLAVVQVWPGTERAQVDGIIGVLAPRRAVYNLTIQNGLTVRALDSSGNYSGVNSANYSIQEEQNYAVRDFPVDAGLTATFITSGYTQTPSLDGSANIAFNKTSSGGTATTPRVVGKVKNTTNMTLNNAVVLAVGGRQEIGTLEPGEEHPFDFALLFQPAMSPPLSLGSAFRSGTYNVAYNSVNYYNGFGQDRTIQDIMGKNVTNLYGRFGLGYGDTPEQQELRRRQALLQAVIDSIEPSGGRGSQVYLVGWTDTSPVAVDLKGLAYTAEDTTLYVYRLPVTISSGGGEVELPSTMLTWTPTNASTRRSDVTPYGLNNLQPGDRIVFRYNPLPGIRFKDISQIKVFLGKTNSYNQGIISLWDWTASQWVDIKANNQTTTILEAQRFLGPENAIEMAVEPAPGVPLAAYDRIDLTISGHLITDS